jgi:aminomethyltransferase
MAIADGDELRRTPLHEAHVTAGARLVAFAGWEMPIDYGSLREEHLTVRSDAGVFDVSHMGQVQISGPRAFERVQRLVSSDIRRVQEGGAQYGLLCNEQGGVIDDLFVYRLAEQSFLIVTNAANHVRDLEWMRTHGVEFDADVTDRIDYFAMLAVQGPRGRELVESISDGELPPRFHCCERTVADVPTLVCGTGYTGEDGVELIVAPDRATEVWDALLACGVRPIGLGARDTLRLEACFHLYGNDLSEQWDPIGAGLGWACAEETGFIGSEAIATVRAAGPDQRLVPFMIEGPGIARQGNPVIGGGVVTSGSYSPSLEAGIGMAYVSSDAADPGARFQIDVRGKIRDAVVHRKPLYGKDS